jgi:dolichol-phosphate mannosyltransferase
MEAMPLPLRVSVVLPTYNESGNIVRLVDRLLSLAAECPGGLEVLVVDDDSPDGTAALVQRTYQHDPRVRVIVRTEGRGLAPSVRCGLEAASGDALVVMDTDFNHDPAHVPMMADLLRHADLVVGSRFVNGGGMEDEFRYYCSWTYNLLIRFALGTRIQDNLSGFFAVRRSLLSRVDFDKVFFGYGDYFFRFLFEATAQGGAIIEVPVYYVKRTEGVSKTNFTSVLWKYSKALGHFVAQEGLVRRRPRPTRAS